MLDYYYEEPEIVRCLLIFLKILKVNVIFIDFSVGIFIQIRFPFLKFIKALRLFSASVTILLLRTESVLFLIRQKKKKIFQGIVGFYES